MWNRTGFSKVSVLEFPIGEIRLRVTKESSSKAEFWELHYEGKFFMDLAMQSWGSKLLMQSKCCVWSIRSMWLHLLVGMNYFNTHNNFKMDFLTNLILLLFSFPNIRLTAKWLFKGKDCSVNKIPFKRNLQFPWGFHRNRENHDPKLSHIFFPFGSFIVKLCVPKHTWVHSEEAIYLIETFFF